MSSSRFRPDRRGGAYKQRTESYLPEVSKDMPVMDEPGHTHEEGKKQ